jgi:hypothetical protein
MKAEEKQKVVRFLQKIGVDIRFVSIVDGQIFINNFRLSRFTRAKEELLLGKYPQYKIYRSKIFQKICTRASRVLKDVLSPRERILLVRDETCINMALYAVLESYTRKYGVQIISSHRTDNLEIKNINSIVLPLTLDDEVENIISEMLNGEQLRLLSSKTNKNGIKLIYPLINVPRQWIGSWAENKNFECVANDYESLPREMLEFLEGFIPDVREKMIKSGVYLSNNNF